ncbi:MAG TPA: YlxR family protein [Candidatus Deferrimicrobiaceae bacterium]
MPPPKSDAAEPQRTCVQCGALLAKPRLLRVAGKPGAGWTPDPSGTLPGRGIYLCRGGDCIRKFSARVKTAKGGARWKMGAAGAELAERLSAFEQGAGKT